MDHKFFAVGIGASAGGVPALKKFFGPIPLNTGIAFIVVTHLKREHESQLDQVIRLHTLMPVCRLTANTRIRPDHIYVLVENTMATLIDGIINVRERGAKELINNSVDIFFASLAADFRKKAVGIILSGSGSDGLKGSKDIEQNGGFVMVQSPESSQFAGMPETIIKLNHPIVLAEPEKLALELL